MHEPEHAADARTTLFCLHYLGGSGRAWARVARLLDARYRVVAIDLPGFGAAADAPGYRVEEMADAVVRVVAAAAPRRWMLVGHSMGAKVAAVVARRAEDGRNELFGLTGIVVLAGSPPEPEPIPDETRARMLGWFSGDVRTSLAQARTYVAANSGAKLDANARESAVADVLRANPVAWRAWLDAGSREDWSARVGILATRALVISGADDENLGPEAQRRLTAPHFANVRFVTLADAKHLLPYECADDVARLIEEHDGFARDSGLGLVGSARVSRETRAALTDRARRDEPEYEPRALDRAELAILRTVVDRVIPQCGAETIDLAARIDRMLARDEGDGWRFAALPRDAEAYRRALTTLDTGARDASGVPFAALDDARKDAMLERVAAGTIEARTAGAGGDTTLTPAQMRAWFEDLRADAVKLYVAHPHTLATMGYSGFANGGDGFPKTGFARIGLDQREAWEPIARMERTR